MQNFYRISLLSVFVIANSNSMEQPSTIPTPIQQAHQQYAEQNAAAYYDAVTRQTPSFISQIGHDIVVQSAVQVMSAAIMLGITSACHGIYYWVKGPTDEQRQIDIILTKNENINRQNKTKTKRDALELKEEKRRAMILAITQLCALPDEIVSPEDKTKAKEQFLKTFLSDLGKKNIKSTLSSQELETGLDA